MNSKLDNVLAELEKTKATKAQVEAATKEIDSIISAGHDWEAREESMDAELYKLLQGCILLVEKSLTTDKEGTAYCNAIYEAHKKVATLYNRKRITRLKMILEIVFKRSGVTARASVSKVSDYKSALEEAELQNIKSDGIATWLTQQGGIRAVVNDVRERKLGKTKATSRKAGLKPREERFAQDASLLR